MSDALPQRLGPYAIVSLIGAGGMGEVYLADDERLGRRDDAMQQYDLLAVDELQPFALQSTSAVINELRALRHDVRSAARRLTAERSAFSRRLLK